MDGRAFDEHRKIVEELGWQEAELQSFQDVLPTFLSQRSYKDQILLPWYGRGG